GTDEDIIAPQQPEERPDQATNQCQYDMILEHGADRFMVRGPALPGTAEEIAEVILAQPRQDPALAVLDGEGGDHRLESALLPHHHQEVAPIPGTDADIAAAGQQ